MRVLDRYIVLALWRNIALSMTVLLVLLAVFLFVNEQGWVGAGTYGQLAALRYVAMQLPSTALAFVPVAVLLGSLLAVGQLARGSEITVISLPRASCPTASNAPSSTATGTNDNAVDGSCMPT